MVVFFTDSDTDITLEEAQKYGFKLISMPYAIGEKVIYPYKDFKTFDAKPYYDLLRDGTIPTTSALNPEEYKAYFEPVFANGDDIFYVHFSRAMSGTFSAMDFAVKELKAKYPERKFYELDTKGITTISYAVVREVIKLKEQGKTPEEILAWADKEVNHFAFYLFAEDLKFFKRSGRVSGFAAFMGGLIGIRPLIYMNDNGQLVSIGKEKGRAKTLKRIVEYVKELCDNYIDYPIYIGNSDCLDTAQELKAMLLSELGQNAKIEIVTVNPTAGAHCGPNGTGVSFHAKHR